MPAQTDEFIHFVPKNINIPVWKYLSFEKFLYIVTSHNFPLIQISQFEDKFEGTLESSLIDDKYMKTVLNSLTHGEDEKTKYNVFVRNRLFNYASCWCMSNYESVALWKLYGKSNNSIALKTSYSKLQENLPNDLYIGKVMYRSNFKNLTQEVLYNLRTYIMTKKPSYSFEKEIRIIKYDTNLYNSFSKILGDDNVDTISKVYNFFFHFNNTIDTIYINPLAETWFEDTVKKVCKQYNITVPVIQSDLRYDNHKLI